MATVKDIFDETAKLVLDLSVEIEELTKKFGESSKLVTTKSEQLATLIQFYETSQTEINKYRRAIHLARIVSDFKDLALMKHETGLSWEKVFKINGFGTEGAKSLDDFDQQFKKFMQDNEQHFG